MAPTGSAAPAEISGYGDVARGTVAGIAVR
jgi:hypothetical protein